MIRRNFLKLSAAAAALAALPCDAFGETSAERAAKGLRVSAQKDRYDQELLIMGGRFDLKVSARDTGGDLCIYDTLRSSKGGPALHRHVRVGQPLIVGLQQVAVALRLGQQRDEVVPSLRRHGAQRSGRARHHRQ